MADRHDALIPETFGELTETMHERLFTRLPEPPYGGLLSQCSSSVGR